MQRPDLIAFDLDGTLLDADCRLPAAHADIVERLTAHGIAVCLATGRPLLTVRGIYRSLALHHPLVCFNGAWIGHPIDGVSVEHPLERAEIAAACDLLADLPGSICLYPEPDRWLVHRFTDRTRGWPELYGVPISEAPEMLAEPPERSSKLMFVCEPEDTEAAHAALRARLSDRLHITASQVDRIEVTRGGVDKGSGLRELLAHLDIPPERAWAVGDGHNDLEMLAVAGRGLAMGHAPRAVRAAADDVLPPIQEAGLTRLIDLIGI